MALKKKLNLNIKVASGTQFLPLARRKYQPTYCVLLFTLKLNPTVRLCHSKGYLGTIGILTFVHMMNDPQRKYFSHMVVNIYM